MSKPKKQQRRRAPAPPREFPPTPAEQVAEKEAPHFAALPLVEFAPALSSLAAECPQLANVIAAEYANAARLPPDAAALYVPPSVSELARRAGVPRSTARRFLLKSIRRTK